MIKMSQEAYEKNMVSATSDGASDNAGVYTGVLTQLSQTRGWLLAIHCANHRIELAFKSALQNSSLKVVTNCTRQFTVFSRILVN